MSIVNKVDVLSTADGQDGDDHVEQLYDKTQRQSNGEFSEYSNLL